MRRFVKLLFLFFCMLNIGNVQASAVTYEFSGGRFGDNLVAYSHAKWISYKFNIPILYQPFPCSDKLAMHKKELFYNNEINKYKEIIRVNKECNIKKDEDILYVVPYFPESELELKDIQFSHSFAVDWTDKNFINILKENIKPLIDLNTFSIPQDYITVAVHIRKGTGYDIQQLNEFKALTFMYPFKFISDSYYIEQINKISEICGEKKLYVCIFTDHRNPYEIYEIYKKEITDSKILLDVKINDNLHDEINILSDFFILTQFDCLIRSDSNFTIMASKLANYKIEISPLDALIGGEVVINKVNIKDRFTEPVIIKIDMKKEKLEKEKAIKNKAFREKLAKEKAAKNKLAKKNKKIKIKKQRWQR